MKLKAGKIFSAICMVLSVMLAASVLVAAQGTEVYINSAYDLKKLAEDVNAGNDYAGVTVILQSDIKLNDRLCDLDGSLINENADEWTAIGTEKNPFRGNFDGNGHAIYGLYINDTEKTLQGLFGVAANAQIRNIYVIDGYINVNAHAGAIVGYATENSVVTSCHNVNTAIYTKDRSGGIAGWTNKTDIFNCSSTGYCKSGRCSGGIVGDVYSNGKIYNCENGGTVEGGSLVGGITGGSTSADIQNCLSIGRVSSGYLIAGGGGSRKITNCFALKNDDFNNNIGGTAYVFADESAVLKDVVKVGEMSFTKVVDALNAYGYEMKESVPMTGWSQHGDLPYLNRENMKTNFGSEVSGWSKSEIEDAYNYNLIPDSLVGEDLTKAITRLEFAAVAVKVYENLSGVKALPATVNPFKDCNDTEMLKAYNQGITIGVSENEFNPNGLLNREQAATMLTRVFKRATMPGWNMEKDGEYKLTYTMPQKFSDDAYISDWARESVYFMNANGIILGVDGNRFAPKNVTDEDEAKGYANATREQALLIAVRIVENLK